MAAYVLSAILGAVALLAGWLGMKLLGERKSRAKDKAEAQALAASVAARNQQLALEAAAERKARMAAEDIARIAKVTAMAGEMTDVEIARALPGLLRRMREGGGPVLASTPDPAARPAAELAGPTSDLAGLARAVAGACPPPVLPGDVLRDGEHNR